MRPWLYVPIAPLRDVLLLAEFRSGTARLLDDADFFKLLLDSLLLKELIGDDDADRVPRGDCTTSLVRRKLCVGRSRCSGWRAVLRAGLSGTARRIVADFFESLFLSNAILLLNRLDLWRHLGFLVAGSN